MDLPADTYEYKAAIDKSWNESYGPGGGSGNITLDHDGGAVTFIYDHRTHIITAQ